MIKKKTIKMEVEITFEYDTDHRNYMNESVSTATALDLAINPAQTIEDGVRLLEVCNREQDYWWMTNPDGDGKKDSELTPLEQAIDYVRRNKTWSRAEEELALERIDKWRCDLFHIDEQIWEEIHDLMEEWSEEHDYPEGWWEEQTDEDDIFFQL